MNLHEIRSKTRDRFPLNARKILKKTIGKTLLWLVIALGLWLSGCFVVGAIAIAILIPLTWLYEAAHFKNYFYDMGDDFFVVRKGVFTTHELVILYKRIQDIYIDQDLLDSMMGLYDVHISSATTVSGWIAHVDGLNKADAEGLRNALLDVSRNARHGRQI